MSKLPLHYHSATELARLLRIGAERAGAVAATTLGRAYDAIGLLPR